MPSIFAEFSTNENQLLNIWATAVVITVLRTRYSQNRDEWSLCERKALRAIHRSIKEHVSPDLGSQDEIVGAIFSAAEQLLQC